VLGGIPDDRDDDRGDEELGEPDLLCKDLEGPDEDLGDQCGDQRRGPEDDERLAKRPPFDVVLGRFVHGGGGVAASTR
jgi:hypothetical protein